MNNYEIPISPAKQNELLASKKFAELEKQKAVDAQHAGALIAKWCKALADGQKYASVDYCYNGNTITIAKNHMLKHGWKVATRIDDGPYHDTTIEATFNPI